MNVITADPIHQWFELSYSNYLVLQRSILQSMPVEWQRKLVALLDELHAASEPIRDELPPAFSVRARDRGGRYITDPFSNYQRGRRVVPLKRKRKA